MEVSEILQNALNKCNLTRDRYDEKNIPASMSDVCIMPYFGDISSMTVLSSILLNRYREEVKGSKYFILCSWPHMGGLFPYVDEYWSVSRDAMLEMYPGCDRLENTSPRAVKEERNLNYFFSDVASTKELIPFYDNGITQEFMKKFRHVKCFKPVLQSSVVLGKDFVEKLESIPGNKVVVHPSKFIYGYKNEMVTKKVPLAFWAALIKEIQNWGMVPVIYQNDTCYDMMPHVSNCVFFPHQNIESVLIAMRTVGCVLDVFSGISRLAITARCPYVMCDERTRYNISKGYEIDCLCGDKIPKEFIFSFANVITEGYYDIWSHSLFRAMKTKLESLFKDRNSNSWPSTSEQNQIVPYANVKIKNNNRMGTRFVKVPHI